MTQEQAAVIMITPVLIAAVLVITCLIIVAIHDYITE